MAKLVVAVAFLVVLAGCGTFQDPVTDTTSVTSPPEPSETSSSPDPRQTATDVPPELKIHATNATTVRVEIAYWENGSVLVNDTFELPSGGFLDFESELTHQTDYDATVYVGDGQVWNHRLSPSVSFELYVDEDEVVQSAVGSGNA